MSGRLLHSPAEIIGQLLVDLSLGSTTSGEDWFTFITFLGNSPDKCLAVYNTTGLQTGTTQTNGEVQLHHGIQILVRGSSPREVFNKSNLILDTLSSTQNTVVVLESSNYLVASVRLTGDIIDIGKEVPQSKRHLNSLNFIVALHQTD